MSASLKASLVAATLVVFTFLGSPGAQAPAGPRRPGRLAPTSRPSAWTSMPSTRSRTKGSSARRSWTRSGISPRCYGPRLTNSPNIRAAAAWAIARMGEWGLTHPRQEVWGQFGRGWVEREVHRQRRDAAAVPAHRVCPGVDAGHERRGDGRRGPGRHRSRRGFQQVAGQAERQGRARGANHRR